jgi:amidase
MGRTVADIAQLLATMAGYHPEAPLSLGEPAEALAGQLDSDLQGLRIGWLGDLGGHLPFEHGVLSICRAAAERMRELGCSVEDATIDFDQERLWRAWLVLRQWLVSNRLKDLYVDSRKRAELKPEATWEIEQGMTLTAADVYDASLVRSDWYRMMLTTFGRFDFLVLPAAQVFPYDVDQPWPAEIDGRRMDTYHRWMEVVVGPTMAGLPVIAMPAGLSESGRPAGIQIIAPPRADLPLLRFAKAYERVSKKAAP